MILWKTLIMVIRLIFSALTRMKFYIIINFRGIWYIIHLFCERGRPKMKILIAEDELPMQKILKLYLEKENYTVETVRDGEEALSLACSHHFDLILLDWMLPKLEGVEVCRQIRVYGIGAKILMLTARGEVADEFAGLSCGADDYVKKPFDPAILMLRIKKLLHTEGLLICGDISLNPQTGEVLLAQDNLSLTKKEYELLSLFMQNKGTMLSRELLLERVWGIDYDGDERTLDTHIRRLRGKVGEGYIKTQVGLGYRMVEFYE